MPTPDPTTRPPSRPSISATVQHLRPEDVQGTDLSDEHHDDLVSLRLGIRPVELSVLGTLAEVTMVVRACAEQITALVDARGGAK